MFEFGFGFFLVVRVFIGVPLHGELSIRFFEVIVFGVTVYLENLVVINAHAFSSSSFFASDFFVLRFTSFLVLSRELGVSLAITCGFGRSSLPQ